MMNLIQILEKNDVRCCFHRCGNLTIALIAVIGALEKIASKHDDDDDDDEQSNL